MVLMMASVGVSYLEMKRGWHRLCKVLTMCPMAYVQWRKIFSLVVCHHRRLWNRWLLWRLEYHVIDV